MMAKQEKPRSPAISEFVRSIAVNLIAMILWALFVLLIKCIESPSQQVLVLVISCLVITIVIWLCLYRRITKKTGQEVLIGTILAALILATFIPSFFALRSWLLENAFSTILIVVVIIALLAQGIFGFLLYHIKKPYSINIDDLIRQGSKVVKDGKLLETLNYLFNGIKKLTSDSENWFIGGQYTDPDLAKPIKVGDKFANQLALKVHEILSGLLDKSPIGPCCIDSDEAQLLDVPGAKFKWVIDPIDGGRHFSRNFPLFTISVALVEVENNTPLLSVIYVPVTKELFFAIKNQGAYLNTWINRLQVSNNSIENSLIHIEFPNKRLLPEFQEDFDKQCEVVKNLFSRANRVRGIGLGSLGLAYVAKGTFDAYVTLTGTTLRNDIVAGILLVEEAGGIVETFDAPEVVKNNIRVIAANKNIFKEIREIVENGRFSIGGKKNCE